MNTQKKNTIDTLDSILHKCDKATQKYKNESIQYHRYDSIISAMEIAEAYVQKKLQSQKESRN